jgi:mannose-6-phosphate isomerase-like protein (cupin superfamily)
MTEQPGQSYERFEASALLAQQIVRGDAYTEFLRRDSMSAGLYILEAGSDDPQQPHSEDELYHVIEGRAVLEVAGQQRSVQPGSIVFVGAGVAHRFHSIASKLAVLVVFSPPETA